MGIRFGRHVGCSCSGFEKVPNCQTRVHLEFFGFRLKSKNIFDFFEFNKQMFFRPYVGT